LFPVTFIFVNIFSRTIFYLHAIYCVLGPFGHHLVRRFTSGRTAHQLFWPILAVDIYCTVSAVLVRLQKTPLNLLHGFYFRLHGSSLQSFFTLSSDPLMSCLGAVFWCLLLPWLLATASGCRAPLLKADISGPNTEYLLTWLYIPSQQLRCLGNTTANSIRCRGSIRSTCTLRSSGFIFPCFVYLKGTSLRRNTEIRTRSLRSTVNLSQYYRMIWLHRPSWFKYIYIWCLYVFRSINDHIQKTNNNTLRKLLLHTS
jgi:hypothetical protein